MITTDRLTLRAPKMEDAPVVTAALQDFDVARWLTGPPYPFTLTHVQEFIRRDHDGKVFYIEDDGGICGAISLTAGRGYWLSKDRWARG